jgi:hypothetical protein
MHQQESEIDNIPFWRARKRMKQYSTTMEELMGGIEKAAKGLKTSMPHMPSVPRR